MFYHIDIHGYTISEAKVYLDSFLANLPATATHVTVVHGYQGGTRLQQFVRRQYRHKKLAKVVLTMNHGESLLILKKP